MTKEELLKIHSAYLPYDLLFYPSEKSDLFHDLYADKFPHTTLNYKLALSENDKDAIKISKSYLKQKSPFIAIDDNELFLGQFESNLGFDVDDVFASEVKPVLWDLSYLTKEIEHNCLIIKPIEYISVSIADRNKILKMVENKEPLDILPQWKFEKLLKFHFNVFQLPEDQYINKASLTTNK